MALRYKRYQKEFPHTYALGTFPVLDLLQARPEAALAVFLKSDALASEGVDRVRAICAQHGIPCEVDDRQIDALSLKENCRALAVLRKYDPPALLPDADHAVLVHPGNAGNLGTIFRAALGFGIRDLALIRPCVDPWNPSVVRSAMGAAFSLRWAFYDDFDAYRMAFPGRPLHAFALGGQDVLGSAAFASPVSLVFGPEGSGLDASVLRHCAPIRIEHSKAIDSLNLAIAASIAFYELARQRRG